MFLGSALINEAAMLSRCDYCQADAYAPCKTYTGNECTNVHMDRMHSAHVLLAEIGIGHKSALLWKSKGHKRKNWNEKMKLMGKE